MELIRQQTNIDFVRVRKYAYILSAAAFLVSLLSLGLRGLNFGIDFTGGTLVDLALPRPVATDMASLRLAQAGLPGATVLLFGAERDLLVRLPPSDQVDKNRLTQQVVEVFTELAGGAPEIRRVEFVGPQVGGELVEKGGLGMLIALGAIGIYIGVRFERRFALAAIAATLHDPIVTLGFFSLTGTPFDLTVLAALLAVIGYSVNDTIVVFDRIRENLRRMRKADPVDVVNLAVNQTMSRTLITSGTTLMVVLALLLFGGPLLYGFSLALLIGILVGTYSTVYVASAVALDLGINRGDVLPPEVDKEAVG